MTVRNRRPVVPTPPAQVVLEDWADALCAVVINKDAGAALLECVASLRSAGVREIVVVDNASSDGSLAQLAAADRAVVLVPTGANLGYGRAANLGAERSERPFVLVCNPDLTVQPDAPRRLVEQLVSEPDVAIVGPTMLDVSGLRYPSARAFPGLTDALGHALLGLVKPDNPFSRRYRLDGQDFEGPTQVDWVSGACMAIRRDAFFSVGGFDPGYFMYVEDLDLCWRLRQAGWRVLHLPDAVVTHVGGLSTKKRPITMLAWHHRSSWRFLVKRTHGPEQALLPFAALALSGRFAMAALLEVENACVAAVPGDVGTFAKLPQLCHGDLSVVQSRAAAASGGGKAYGSRRPISWYALIIVIVLAGVSLVVYSRNENLHPAARKSATVGPTATDHWQAALAVDICGTVQKNLPANSDLSEVGIRTFGNGLIDMDPGAIPAGTSGYTASNYEGANVTLGLFAEVYPDFTLTSTSIQLPGGKLYKNGDKCTGTGVKTTGVGKLQAWVWSSPKAKGHLLTTDLTKYHLTNGAMITVAFVPVGTKIPVPPSKSALVSALGSAS